MREGGGGRKKEEKGVASKKQTTTWEELDPSGSRRERAHTPITPKPPHTHHAYTHTHTHTTRERKKADKNYHYYPLTWGFVTRIGSVMLLYSTVPTAALASMGVKTK
jgi:hypothetical protein